MTTCKTRWLLVVLPGLLFLPPAVAAGKLNTAGAPRCAAHQQRVNDNNNLLLLGGTAKGPMRQFIVGEFGKDVDRQKRMMGQFDRCGVLTQADIHYDKRENNTRLKLDLNIVRILAGWRADYDITLFGLRNGDEVVLQHKQGTTRYYTGRIGNIVSASERYVLQNAPGFSTTTNDFDAQSRLIRSVVRGSDSQSEGESIYRWSAQNRLISSTSAESTVSWIYDSSGREAGVNVSENSPFMALTTQDRCQLWDEHQNCTLSYARESEVSALGMFRRNIAAGSRYDYWDQP